MIPLETKVNKTHDLKVLIYIRKKKTGVSNVCATFFKNAYPKSWRVLSHSPENVSDSCTSAKSVYH